MANIASYPVMDFSGGVRRDKSSFEMRKNELLDARNIIITDKGKIKTRRGAQQIGQTLSGTIENSYYFQRSSTTPAYSFFVNTTGTGLYRLVGTQVASFAVAVGDATITVGDTTDFTASGTIEIEGDLITYTGKTGSTFTGCGAITSAHAIGTPVHQWETISTAAGGPSLNGGRGVYYAVLENNLYMAGCVGNSPTFKYINNNDAKTVSDITGEPSGMFLTNFQDRLYCAEENSPQNRLYFSADLDGTTWTPTTDYIDINNQEGGPITGLKVLGSHLGIFKINTTFSYDEIDLRLRFTSVGAYNHKVIQEIDGKLYTFCPTGIYVTNLLSSKQIGEPVREFWENFTPVYDDATTGIGRIVTNTFSGTYKQFYLLYIYDITSPTTTNDVVLAYDTTENNWSVYDGGFTNFFFLNGHNSFAYGSIGTDNEEPPNSIPSLWGGGSGSRVYRFFENTFTNLTHAKSGGTLFQDLFADTGTPVQATFETPLYDLTHPELFKKFKRLRVYTESGQWNLEYRVENEQGITGYQTLGRVSTTNSVLPFPNEAQGWRCGFRVSCVNPNGTSVFNGLVFEDTEVTPRP